ncbi:hypothetical protein MKW92_020796 [Papaver armeniacum]|nr:hypothetical protein MKW92_009653 [Papaver armeniacum]KAI3971780.1 hypothetical protein MKW92_020796 [Papaver armeniacum]
MANYCKNVAVLYLMCILASVVAFQLCKADSDLQEGDVYKQCLKECDDKCKAEGYGEVFCHAKCSKPCEYQQKDANVKQVRR